MADKEYIKRDDVIELIENAIRYSDTVNEVLVCAHLRKAVMGLRPADVAPMAEVAREIFEEIEDALEGNYNPDVCADYPDPHYYLWLADDIAELKKKYTEDNNE